MKIDILTLAGAVMPLVPAHLKPLAEAVVLEVKTRREEAKAQAQHIAELTERVNKVTRYVYLQQPTAGTAN